MMGVLIWLLAVGDAVIFLGMVYALLDEMGVVYDA